MDKPEVVDVLEVRKENSNSATIQLDKKLDAKPGQFVMLWIPKVDEKPFSLSRIKGNVEITFDVKGPFTQRLFSLKKGSLVGIRGPYGNGWEIKGKNLCLVAGGLGLAPMMPIIEGKGNKKITLIFGVKSDKNLMLQDRLKKAGVEILFTTDDGSFGAHCYACDILEETIKKGKHDQILTCGPEILMKKVADIAEKLKIPCQISMERYMKCGIEMCGSCCFGPKGLRVCKEGPVFWAHKIGKGEFGFYTRDKSGSKLNL